jgi:opacity protein-like surface antigen
MSKLILKNLMVLILVTPAAFANDSLSTFNQQGDLSYPKPTGEENYLATQAPSHYSYIGINAGTNINSLKSNLSVNSTSGSSTDKPLSYTGGIYGGLGASYDNFYIGAELSCAYNSLSKKTTIKTGSANNSVSIKQQMVVGLDLRPGYLTDQKDFLFYGRLGLGTGLFKLQLPNDPDVNTQKFVFGWRAGLGMEYFMNETIGLRLEYLFNSYNNAGKSYKNNSTNYTYQLHSPSSHQINLGLTFNF